MSLDTNNVLYVLGALLLGAFIGETLGIDAAIEKWGSWAQRTLPGAERKDGSRNFAKGFVISSLLFCVGPMAILGSIQDGLTGDFSMLTLKAVLDGTAALAFASSLGIGVAFAALPLLVYQGALTFASQSFQVALDPSFIAEFTASGGILIFAVGLGLLEVKRIKVANLLPAVFIAPLIAYLVSRL